MVLALRARWLAFAGKGANSAGKGSGFAGKEVAPKNKVPIMVLPFFEQPLRKESAIYEFAEI